MASRARAFGAIMAMDGIGAAAGPLIGGLITSAISWRAVFVFQALVIVVIVVLSRKIDDPLPPDPARLFDTVGAVLSAAGLVLLVTGILAVTNGWLALGLLLTGAAVLVGFFAWCVAASAPPVRASAASCPPSPAGGSTIRRSWPAPSTSRSSSTWPRSAGCVSLPR
ncbi:MFS transporter [Streptomyces sp. NPDC048252]|uniref:MFS transporter n=1 Tax=Streptomyces sp. NPDC048252 TaxID=3154612 RepID=UPI003418B32E